MTREELVTLAAQAAFLPDDKAEEVLSAIEAAGFAIVPVVPSEGIELAGLNASDGWIDLSDAEIIYSAMIQAAKDEMK
jgi:predicted CoA-binding protein